MQSLIDEAKKKLESLVKEIVNLQKKGKDDLAEKGIIHATEKFGLSRDELEKVLNKEKARRGLIRDIPDDDKIQVFSCPKCKILNKIDFSQKYELIICGKCKSEFQPEELKNLISRRNFMDSAEFIEKKLEASLESIEMVPENKKKILGQLVSIIEKFTDEAQLNILQSKLKILFEYEKHYLELIKDFKEEIKFVNQIQEDIRRERANFFSQTLKEVSETLKSAQVDPAVISKWMQELVDSYTKSLELSSELAKTEIVELNFQLKEEAKKSVKKANIKEG